MMVFDQKKGAKESHPDSRTAATRAALPPVQLVTCKHEPDVDVKIEPDVDSSLTPVSSEYLNDIQKLLMDHLFEHDSDFYVAAVLDDLTSYFVHREHDASNETDNNTTTYSKMEANRAMVSNAAGYVNIIMAMRKFFYWKRVQTSACRALGEICYDNLTFAESAVQNGALEAILLATKNFSTDANAQCECFFALKNLLLL
jgi:hypothetical protein